MQQKVTVPTQKSVGILDQVIISEEVKVSEHLISFVTSSDHGVVHYDLPQKHDNLAVKKISCKKWRILDVIAFTESLVALIDRDNPKNVWNIFLMNEISYVDKDHPLKTKYIRNHTCLFPDYELKTMKRSRRKFEKAFAKEW